MPVRCVLSDCVLGYYEKQNRSNWASAVISGSTEQESGFIVFYDLYDWSPKVGDVWQREISGSQYEVVGHEYLVDGGLLHHYAVEVKLRNNLTLVADD